MWQSWQPWQPSCARPMIGLLRSTYLWHCSGLEGILEVSVIRLPERLPHRSSLPEDSHARPYLLRLPQFTGPHRPAWFREGRYSGAAGLSLADVLRGNSSREAEKRSRLARQHQLRHHPLDARRAEPHRHVGPQAGRPGRDIAASSAPSRPTCPASGSPTCCRCRRGSWTSGRSSAACITTTRATRPATRFASPATTPDPTRREHPSAAAARSSPSSSAT